MRSTRDFRAAKNSSYTLSCTNKRLPATQLWPLAAKIPATTPFTALLILASAKIMLGDLPPSSRLIWARFCALFLTTALAPAPPPVKAIRRTSGCLVNAAPVSAPNPVTTLTTPSGKPASLTKCISSTIVALACSEGLSTTVLPAANAGASFTAVKYMGEFQGIIAATTPKGS